MNKLSKIFRSLLILVLIAVNSIVWANDKQFGGQFLTNIKYHNEINNYVWSIAQSSRNTLVVACRTGVLEYNSEEWISIETPDISLSLLASRVDDRIYTCGRNHIGYLKQNNFGKYVFYPITEGLSSRGVFTDIFEADSGVYFYSSKKLLYFNSSTNSLSTLKEIDSTVTFIGSFIHKNKLYLSVLNKGVFIVENNTLTNVKGLEQLNNQPIVFSSKFDENAILIGTQSGKLFLLSSKGIVPYTIDNDEYLQKGILSDGILFSDSQIAISFKNLGLIIIDKYTGEITDIINRESGLPDEFVMTLFVDKDKTLWIANPQGLSRIDASLPIKNYSSYFGIEGSIITSNFWNNKLYVATSEGVFILDSISKYDTREAYKKIPIVNNAPIDNRSKFISDNLSNQAEEPVEEQNIAKEEQKKNRRGLFKRLFDTKEEPEKIEKPTPKPAPIQSTQRIEIQKFEYFQYQQFILKSKHVGFTPLGELKERCNNLISFNNQLLAVTDSKIYSIDSNKKLTALFSGSNILEVIPSKSDSKRIYIVDKKGIYVGIWESKHWRFTLKTESDINNNITSLAELSNQSLLISLNNQLVKVNLETGEITDIALANPYSESIILKQLNEGIFVLVGTRIYTLDKADKNETKFILFENVSVARSFLKQPNQFCIKTAKNTYKYYGMNKIPDKAMAALKIFNDINDIHIDSENTIWIINNSDEIYRLNTLDFQNYNLPCIVYLGEIRTLNGTLISGDKFKLNHAENALTFSFVSPSTLKLNSNQYQYIIEGLMDDWSDWTGNTTFTIPYLPAGSYHLKFRAKNILEETSAIVSIQFKVLPPFWNTFYFYALIILIVVLGLYYLQKFRLKRLIKEKEILQEKIRERTEELQIKNIAITDSINYAGKIQKALLPPQEKLDSLLSDYFVYYRPKDIISGDFYLAVKRKRYTVIIAADCTGHGVPGAFMSMLGMAYIYDVLSAADSSITAAEILNILRNKIITLLQQHGEVSRDGMDMVVLLFDRKNNNLQYAGAHNPLYRLIPKKYKLSEVDSELVSNENDNFYLLQYKPNRFPVGNSKKAHIDFTNHVINYEADEQFYIFSDGYADQFGSEGERKFMYGRFRELIISNAHKSLRDQRNSLDKTLKEWKNENPQTDDILIFGMRP